jgi:hypothetical protein
MRGVASSDSPQRPSILAFHPLGGLRRGPDRGSGGSLSGPGRPHSPPFVRAIKFRDQLEIVTGDRRLSAGAPRAIFLSFSTPARPAYRAPQRVLPIHPSSQWVSRLPTPDKPTPGRSRGPLRFRGAMPLRLHCAHLGGIYRSGAALVDASGLGLWIASRTGSCRSPRASRQQSEFPGLDPWC